MCIYICIVETSPWTAGLQFFILPSIPCHLPTSSAGIGQDALRPQGEGGLMKVLTRRMVRSQWANGASSH
jgi:hypothetical protein